jgi:hypothetical protein
VETEKTKLIRGDEYTFPNVPSESCHMAINGVIVDRSDACIHGAVGDVWCPVSQRIITVTSIDDKSVTIDIGWRAE